MHRWVFLSFGMLMWIGNAMATEPSVEERALAMVLEGDVDDAIALLEKTAEADPSLRWVAGRVALNQGDTAEAWRLFDGDAPADMWGRIEVSLANGDAAGAASVALSEMDRAVSGTHRDALGALLLEWAGKRADKDPVSASNMLEIVLELGVSDALRARAEDAFFRMPGAEERPRAVAAARRRLSSRPSDPGAAMVFGLYLANVAPAQALPWLSLALENGDRRQALRSARTLLDLAVPAPERVAALDALADRFPQDHEVARLRLELATSIAVVDDALGGDALAALIHDPEVGDEAFERYAETVRDPVLRRERWLALAAPEGASARGERARREATAALVEIVESYPEGESRRKAAQEALNTADGRTVPEILYWALADDEERVAKLWDLAERFPGDGPWCAELAAELLTQGATRDQALQYSDRCGNAEGVEAAALVAFAGERPMLVAQECRGGLTVIAAGASSLSVSEHRVDPVALFRATSGNPLDTTLDAFLVEPDTSYSVTLDPEMLRAVKLVPRTDGTLLSITVRVDDLQASTLVIPNRLEVQGVIQGDSVGLAVLQEQEPVPDARVLLLDESGEEVELRTDDQGTLLSRGHTGDVRVMVEHENALGFLVVPGAAPTPETVEHFHIQPWDRLFSAEGQEGRVEVFGARPDGPIETTLTLQSTTASGAPLDQTAVDLVNGAGSATLWLQGGGVLRLTRGDEKLVEVPVPKAPETEAPGVQVAVSPPTPRAGDTLRVTVFDTGLPSPDGKDLDLTIETPWDRYTWSHVMTESFEEHAVDLNLAAPGDRIQVQAALAGQSVAFEVAVAPPPAPPRPAIDPVAVQGHAVSWRPTPESWLLVRAEGTDLVRWVKDSDDLAFSAPGRYWVSTWVHGARSEEVPVTVVPADGRVDARGRWKGTHPVLVADTGPRVERVRLVRPGERVAGASPVGARYGWSVPGEAGATPLPRHGVDRPPVSIEGTLERGKTSTLLVGADLPPGTRIWAFVHDFSDLPTSGDLQLGLQDVWEGAPGRIAPSRAAGVVSGTPIDQALLEEEQRGAEQAQARIVPLEQAWQRDIAAESLSAPALVAGAESAGGGVGMHKTRRKTTRGRWAHLGGSVPPHDPRALTVVEDGTPGALAVAVPPWTTVARVLVVAMTPDGRWLSGVRRVPVEGSTPRQRKPEPPPVLPDTWDGDPATLLAAAQTLPVEPRRHALASLVAAGYTDAAPILKAALDPGLNRSPTLAGASLASRLAGTPAPPSAEAVRALRSCAPDSRQADQALLALALAGERPDRARMVAERLLRNEDLPPWIRARASLTLWVVGDDTAALAALNDDHVLLSAARAAISGVSDPEHAPGWWAIARDEAAYPYDRALAIHALTTALGNGVPAVALTTTPPPLPVEVEIPSVEYHGRTFSRPPYVSPSLVQDASPQVPLYREVNVSIIIGPMDTPTRVRCPNDGTWSSRETWKSFNWLRQDTRVTCSLRALEQGTATAVVDWYDATGKPLGSGRVSFTVGPPRASRSSDAMTVQQAELLGMAMIDAGDPEGVRLLSRILNTELDPRRQMPIIQAFLDAAPLVEDPSTLVRVFEIFREYATDGELDLETAAHVAHAYGETGALRRAVAAAKVVLNARFQEELGAIRRVQEEGFTLTALRLLQELTERYPEVSTVQSARYLAPSMLLQLAEGDQDRHGYTRASLRHTAAAGFARFLLLHPDARQAPDAATLLMDTLQELRSPEREEALAGLLAERYRDFSSAWRLGVADARARLANGRAHEAEAILVALPRTEESSETIAFELGRVYEAEGKVEEALAQYALAPKNGEAQARKAWLERTGIDLPELVVLAPREPRRLVAHIPEGTRVTLTAYRIALEHLLLRNGGRFNPSSVRVDGFRPERSDHVIIEADGNIPLPRLSDGAYLLTVGFAGATYRTVLLQSDGMLVVRPGTQRDTLVHLFDHKGRPIPDAHVWLFDGGGVVDTGRTDVLGSLHVPFGNGHLRVLARWEGHYAWWAPAGEYVSDEWSHRGWPERRQGFKNQRLIEQNVTDYNLLFRQEGKVQVQAREL